MKNILKHNDPKLTAYALGELSRDEAAEIALQLKGNPALLKEVDQIDSLGIALTKAFGNEEEVKLSAKQRAAIFQSGKTPSNENVVSMHKKQWLRPVIVTMGAAAALAITFTVLNNMAGRDDLPSQISFQKIQKDDMLAPIVRNQSKWNNPTETAGTSQVSSNSILFDNASKRNVETMGDGLMHHPTALRNEIENTAATSPPNIKLVELTENNWENRADKAMSRLPLVCGNASWKWMEQWIDSIHPNSNTHRPSKNAVRIDEILNHFHYNNPADIQIGNIHSGVSLVQCPWNQNHQIAVALVQNRSKIDSYAEAAVTMSQAVSRYRLLGYAKTTEPNSAKTAPTRVKLAPGYSHLVIYEIELNSGINLGDDVLTVTLNTESADTAGTIASNSLSIQHSNLTWTKAPQDVQFSLILTSWAQIIADSKFDGEMNAQKVREMINYFEATHTPTSEQSKAIAKIKLSLEVL